VYDRTVNGELNSFGVSGKLIRNTLVMYDRNTGSYWTQILGEAIEGELVGTTLEYVPAIHTTWADWQSQHPDSQALVKGYYGNGDQYASYYRSGQTGVIPQTNQDDRLYEKEFVIGVNNGEDAVAYPFGVLNSEPVVNDQIGDLPVLVVFDVEAAAGIVYNRTIANQLLTFRQGERETLVDNETGTIWNANSGEAISGDFIGQTLTRVKSTHVFWFGWNDWFPQSRIYGQ
jgi:hypothetical protein